MITRDVSEPSAAAIPWRGGMAPDGSRYKALGNSMAVPCMAWIGRRIATVDAICATPSASQVDLGDRAA